MSITEIVESIAGFLSSTKKFFQKIGQKLGLGMVAGTIQNGISIVVISTSIAFFGFVVYFILNMYSAFSNFLNYLNNIQAGGTWPSCFIRILQVSGVSSGIQMSMPFLLSLLVFYFSFALYQIVSRVLKTFSDESFKTSEAYK